MTKINQLAGQRFGQLLVIERKARRDPEHAAWLCKCDCGNEIIARGTDLLRGRRQTCGKSEHTGRIRGPSRKRCTNIIKANRSTYSSWAGMRQRCNNSKSPRYKDYGGRGIKICERWNDFEVFLADLGPRPAPDYWLERKDCDGNYEPDNCCWAHRIDQARNRRKKLTVLYRGEQRRIYDLAKEFKIMYSTLWMRIRSGWPIEEALTEPVWGRAASPAAADFAIYSPSLKTKQKEKEAFYELLRKTRAWVARLPDPPTDPFK